MASENNSFKNQSGLSGKNITAFLGKETYFKGVIQFEGTMRIDGKVDGEIISNHTLIIGETAEIDGAVRVRTVVCGGQITGEIESGDSLHLVKPSKVKAKIQTRSLLVEEGVIFNGQCEMPESGSGDSDKTKK